MLFEMNGIGCIFVDRPRWKGQWVIVGGLTGKMTSKKPSCFSWKTISKKKNGASNGKLSPTSWTLPLTMLHELETGWCLETRRIIYATRLFNYVLMFFYQGPTQIVSFCFFN